MPSDRYCACPGVIPGMPTYCENLMTQEDLLCDRCRVNCAGPEGERAREEWSKSQEAIEKALGTSAAKRLFPDTTSEK